jgi:hypothetical protein
LVLTGVAGSKGPALAGAGEAPICTWTATITRDDARLQLSVARVQLGGHSRHSWPIELTQLVGLTRAQVEARHSDVAFELRREAGTLRFTGRFESGRGAGRYDFTASPTFAEALRQAGFPGVDQEELFRLALLDVGQDFIHGFQALYADVSLEDLCRLRIHGAMPEMVHEFHKAGLNPETPDDLARLCIHGVTPERVRAYAALGLRGLGADELIRMSIHGASPGFVRELRALGYDDLGTDAVIRMAIHGASPDFVRDLAKVGYRGIAAEQLIRMRIHGVTPSYIRSMSALGYDHVSSEDLIRMRIHDVTPEFVREVRSLVRKSPPVEELIRHRIHNDI